MNDVPWPEAMYELATLPFIGWTATLPSALDDGVAAPGGHREIRRGEGAPREHRARGAGPVVPSEKHAVPSGRRPTGASLTLHTRWPIAAPIVHT
jgi:hypothetical protein